MGFILQFSTLWSSVRSLRTGHERINERLDVLEQRMSALEALFFEQRAKGTNELYRFREKKTEFGFFSLFSNLAKSLE